MIEDRMLAEQIRAAVEHQTEKVMVPPGMARVARLRRRHRKLAQLTLASIGAAALLVATATLYTGRSQSGQPASLGVTADQSTSASLPAPASSPSRPAVQLSCGVRVPELSGEVKGASLSLHLLGPTRVTPGTLFSGRVELGNSSKQGIHFLSGDKLLMVISQAGIVVGFAPDPRHAILKDYLVLPGDSILLDASIPMRVCREGPTKPQSLSSPLQPGKYSVTAFLVGEAEDTGSTIASASMQVTVSGR